MGTLNGLLPDIEKPLIGTITIIALVLSIAE